MSPTDAPIVVLDSGLGGLTVARAIRATLPHEDILYFGDTARVPYGSKTATTVTTFVRQILAYFRSYAPKHVVVACNTATALALPIIRGEFPELSISGVIDPGAKAAVMAAGAKETPLIGIIGTEATIKSKAYERAIHRRRSMARLLLRPTSLLVPIIEEGRSLNDPIVTLALRQYLAPLIDRGIDVLVLGCTHYPILKPIIEKMVGPSVRVIDSAERCAEDVARRLVARGMLRSASNGVGRGGGKLRCFVTDNSPRFTWLADRFLGMKIDPPTLVSTDELYEGERRPQPLRPAI
jgi:glutamate racemase